MPSDKELEKEAKKIFDEFERDLRAYIDKRMEEKKNSPEKKKSEELQKEADRLRAIGDYEGLMRLVNTELGLDPDGPTIID